MQVERNILVLDNEDSVYDRPFMEHGTIIHNANKLEDADLVVFTGGHDVSPYLYGDSKHPLSSCSSPRDNKEQDTFTKAYIMSIPMVGICRGAQFLNVMNNGLMLQHVDNHSIGGTHRMLTKEGRELNVTSTHHQLMIPNEGEIIGWSAGLVQTYETGGKLNRLEITKPFRQQGGFVIEPEVVYWERTGALGVQYHPEYMNPDSDGWLYFQELLKRYIFNEPSTLD